MDVLVTGAAGFLGRWFVRYLHQIGASVDGVDDLSNPYSYWPKELRGALCAQADLGDWLGYAHKMKYDLAFHFAAPVGGREKIERDPLFNADSLRLDSQFFRWAVGRVGTVIYPSSSAVYGVRYQTSSGDALREDFFDPSDITWARPDEVYGFSKMAAEILAYKASDYGLNTLCIRPFSGYGEGQSPEYPVPAICQRALNREDPLVVWGSGQQTRDFVHVEDVVAATMQRVDAGVNGYQVMNIGSGEAVPFDYVAKLAARIVGYEPEITNDPSKPQGVAARFAHTGRMRQFHIPQIPLMRGLTRVMEHLKNAPTHPA